MSITRELNFFETLELMNPEDYAQTILLNFNDRLDIYLNHSIDQMEKIINFKATQIIYSLGLYSIQINLNILGLFHKLRYAQMFLSVVTNMIILLFSCLCIMMLYNLLLVSVETKTYELGVIRILGLNKLGVVFMILTQSVSFVFPGVIIGLLLSM